MIRSQFALFETRRFLPLFFTQFLGAFNDNVFKNAMVVLIAWRLAAERCLPDGCKFGLALEKDRLWTFKAGNAGRVVFQDAGGRNINVPFSLKGFTAAFNSLTE